MNTPRNVVVGFVSLVTAAAMLLPLPATARPTVASSWRSEPEAAAVAVTPVGRTYTVGTLGIDEGCPWETPCRVVLRAYRPDGTLLWERVWRLAGGSVLAHDVAVGPGGMVLVAGGVKLADPPRGCDEIWNGGWAIRAYGPEGDVLWQRTQPGWRACEVFGTSGRAVAGAGTTVAMAVQVSSEYSQRARILAFDFHGKRRWQRTLRVPGSRNELVDDVAVAVGGVVYLAATRNVIVPDSEERDQDALLVKLRRDGTTAWMRAAPDRTLGVGEDHDYGTSVATIRRGAVFAAVLDEADRAPRARVARYSATGVLRWHRSIVGAYLGAGSWRWRDAFVATWSLGVILAGTERNADRRGTHVNLRGYDGAGKQQWRLRLGPGSDGSWGSTGLDAARRSVAAAGRPAAASDWSRVWRLSG